MALPLDAAYSRLHVLRSFLPLVRVTVPCGLPRGLAQDMAHHSKTIQSFQRFRESLKAASDPLPDFFDELATMAHAPVASDPPTREELEHAEAKARFAYGNCMADPSEENRRAAEQAIYRLAREETRFAKVAWIPFRPLSKIRADIWEGRLSLDPQLAHADAHAKMARTKATIAFHHACIAFHEHEAGFLAQQSNTADLENNAEAAFRNYVRAVEAAHDAEACLLPTGKLPIDENLLKIQVWQRANVRLRNPSEDITSDVSLLSGGAF